MIWAAGGRDEDVCSCSGDLLCETKSNNLGLLLSCSSQDAAQFDLQS